MLACAATHVQPITGWHSLFPISSARILIGVPCGSPAISGRDTGLPCSLTLTGQVRLRLFPDGVLSVCLQYGRRQPTMLPFWLWLISIFSHFGLTRFIIGSHMLAILSSPPPTRVMLIGRSCTSRFGCPFQEGTLSRWLRTFPLPGMHAPIGYC